MVLGEPRESATCPTSVKEGVMLVGHSRRAISNALGMGFTRGMYPVSLALNGVCTMAFPRVFDLAQESVVAKFVMYIPYHPRHLGWQLQICLKKISNIFYYYL